MTLHNFRILCPSALLYPDEGLRERSLHQACWWTVPKKVYRNSLSGTLALAAMVEFHKRVGTWSRKVDCFIALTDWAKGKLVEGGLPAERIVVKPNAVAKPPIVGDLRRNGGLFVGRLDEHHKGVATLLNAWKEIEYPLRIIGDGPLASLVEQAAGDRVEYLGRQPRERVLKEMQAAEFLLFPSRGHELFPMTIIEAFASRLPVICSDLPWARGVVEPDVTGIVVPAGDVDALADQVRWALSNRSALEEMAARAYAAYQVQYTPEANFNRLMAIYAPWSSARSGPSRQCREVGRNMRRQEPTRAAHRADQASRVNERSAAMPAGRGTPYLSLIDLLRGSILPPHILRRGPLCFHC